MASDESEMRRGIAQVMYRFGPESLFDYGRRGLTMRVHRWETDEVGAIDENFVADHIHSLAQNFRGQDDASELWEDLTADDLDFRRPNRVVGKLFPLVMYCENLSCGRVVSKSKPQHFLHTGGQCPECGEDLQQLPFVLVHDCGEMMQINPQPCDNPEHGYDHLYLEKQNRNDAGTWYFYCGKCNNFCGRLSKRCEKCHRERVFYRPVASNSIYYAQGDVLINLPLDQRYEDSMIFGEDWSRVLMHHHVGQLSNIIQDEGKTLEEIAHASKDEQDSKRRKQQLDQLRDELGDDQFEAMKASDEIDLDQMMESMETVIQGSTREDVVQENQELVTIPAQRIDDASEDEAFSQLAHELFTYIRSTNGYEGDPQSAEGMDRQPQPLSLDELLSRDDFVRSNPDAELYPEKLERAQIEKAWVVDNLPLLNFTYGFTRDKPDKNQTDLQPFPHPRGDDEIPIYTDRTPSEAIVLQIDRAAMVDWLVDKGTITRSQAPDTSSTDDLKRWFLESIHAHELQDRFNEPTDPVTKDVYTLLHSMSHALLRTASGQCGLASDSISEYVMPSIPAIFLYASSTEHFALGGMFTLFKTRIHPWIDQTIKDVLNCIYDPVCEHEEGACHACMFMGETACEGGNLNLDRRYLIGKSDQGIPAFWDTDHV